MMGAAIMAFLAGICLIAMIIYPMGVPTVRSENMRGMPLTWAEWRHEFAFSVKFYNPLIIFYECWMGWDRVSEMLFRTLMSLAGLFILVAGVAMIVTGVFLWGLA